MMTKYVGCFPEITACAGSTNIVGYDIQCFVNLKLEMGRIKLMLWKGS